MRAVLFLAILVPAASAHVVLDPNATVFTFPTHVGLVESAKPFYVNETATLRLRASTGGFMPSHPSDDVPIIWFAEAGSASINGTFQLASDARWATQATFPRAGTWNFTLDIQFPQGRARAMSRVQVYRDWGISMGVTAPVEHPAADAPFTLAFNATGPASQNAREILVRLQQHGLRGNLTAVAEPVPATHIGEGRWQAELVAPRTGGWQLAFAVPALNISFDDLPAWQLEVSEAKATSTAVGTPAPAALVPVVLVALLMRQYRGACL